MFAELGFNVVVWFGCNTAILHHLWHLHIFWSHCGRTEQVLQRPMSIGNSEFCRKLFVFRWISRFSSKKTAYLCVLYQSAKPCISDYICGHKWSWRRERACNRAITGVHSTKTGWRRNWNWQLWAVPGSKRQRNRGVLQLWAVPLRLKRLNSTQAVIQATISRKAPTIRISFNNLQWHDSSTASTALYKVE